MVFGLEINILNKCGRFNNLLNDQHQHIDSIYWTSKKNICIYFQVLQTKNKSKNSLQKYLNGDKYSCYLIDIILLFREKIEYKLHLLPMQLKSINRVLPNKL